MHKPGNACDGVRDEVAEHRRKLEGVTAVACRNKKPRPLWVVIHPEIAVERVAVKAEPRPDERGVGKTWKRVAQEGAEARPVVG